MVTITIKNLQKKIPIHPRRIRKAVLKALSLEGVKKSGEITICFLNDRKIEELNLMYLGSDCPTDVIAFDLSAAKDDEISADLAISTDTAIRNARIFKTSPAHELYLYTIHGLLHLLGYDDKTSRQKKIMQGRTNRILSSVLGTACSVPK